MKKIYPLTNTQRDYAGNHVGLVYKFLYLNHLDIDEYYDIVIFGYLLAVQLYDEAVEKPLPLLYDCLEANAVQLI